MGRILVLLVVLGASLLYSFLWNTYRKPYCASAAVQEDVIPVDTVPAAVFTEPSPVEKELFEPLDVYFQSGSLELVRTEDMQEWLALAKAYLAENESKSLLLTGHTDEEGTPDLNLQLSLERATRVKEILVNEGFTAEHLVTEGKGETEPLTDNSTPEGKQKNRRVSIRLIK